MEDGKSKSPQEEKEDHAQDSKQDDGASGDADENDNKSEFVNRGLLRWEAARAKWIESKNIGAAASNTNAAQFEAISLDVNEVIDVIFAKRWRDQHAHEGKPECFPRPVPLPQLIDIYVDLWEAEGLDV
mmetsp:Transcript_21152/g.58853  ORF Transcript_21152/g.58853 Transcript_21152/m.58853 type:complete len:129 (+) Transcript_21152:1356-1742(+)